MNCAWMIEAHGRKDAQPRATVEIALVGKYVELPDAYLSVVEALRHGGIDHSLGVNIRWVASSELENRPRRSSQGRGRNPCPWRFWEPGIEGKIAAIRYAREKRIPYLGICLGMQLAVVEFARNVCGLEEANSTEFNEFTPNPVIDLLPEQKRIEKKGGTMRLGLYPCRLNSSSLIKEAYNQELIYERHRHRYEFNNSYRSLIQSNGMIFSGLSPDERLVEVIELPDHPWFLGCQFHPELKSRPNRPSPLFRDFVKASYDNKIK